MPGSRVTFLHAGVHRRRLRDEVALTWVEGRRGDAPLMVTCPGCFAVYFAELAFPEGVNQLIVDERAAIVRLHQECPDHPHRFAVGE